MISTLRRMGASFLDPLSTRSRKSVVLHYVASADARDPRGLQGQAPRRLRPVRAKEGRNTIRWNGRAGKGAARAGLYPLVLRAT